MIKTAIEKKGKIKGTRVAVGQMNRKEKGNPTWKLMPHLIKEGEFS